MLICKNYHFLIQINHLQSERSQLMAITAQHQILSQSFQEQAAKSVNGCVTLSVGVSVLFFGLDLK